MKALITIISVLFCFAVNAQTIHFIMVSDINNSDEGVAAGRITEYMKDKTFVPNLRIHTGMNVNVVDVCGNGFSLENLNKKLDQLKTAEGDVIFFYYCGHGFNARVLSDPYPTLWFGNISKTRSFVSVYNSLIGKPHRLLIAIAEACNKEIESRPVNREIVDNGGDFAPKAGKTEKYKKLFCNSSGNYIMCSSSKGELSLVGNNWGCFSRAFINVFERSVEYNNNPNPTWDDIFNDIVTKTGELSYKEFAVTQHPQWKKEGGSMPTPHVTNKVLSSSVERKLSKMFEIPKDRSEGMCFKGKYFNLETSPSGLVLAKCSNSNIPSKFFFGHMGRDDFYPAIQTMIITDADDFLVIDLNNSNNYRQYDSQGNISSNTTSSKKNYRYSCIEYANGDIYSGETVNGKYDGFGVFVWANGNSWYGQWCNGIRLGYGIFCPYDGSRQVIIGYWNNHEYRSQ